MSRVNHLQSLAVATVFCLAGAAGMYAVQSQAQAPRSADQDRPGDNDKEKSKGQLPAAVKTAADKFFGTSYIHRPNVIEGETQYVCTGEKGGKETDAVFTESGDLFIVRRYIKPSEMSGAALANFRHDYKDAKVTKVAQVEAHYFTITFDQNGKEQKVKTYPNGREWKHTDLD